MCLFRRKKVNQFIEEDKEKIKKIEAYIDVVMKANTDEDVLSLCEKIKKEVHFFMPAKDKKCLNVDKDICNLANDLASDLMKGKNTDKDNVLKALKEIDMQISLRGASL